MSTTFIYILRDPDTGEIRYCGKSDRPLARLKAHIEHARRGVHRHVYYWIRSLLERGKAPVLEIVMEVPMVWWPRFEIGMISRLRAAGYALTNGTEGGEGIDNPSEEIREKRRKKMLGPLNPNFGIPQSEERKDQRRRTRLATNTSGFPGVSYYRWHKEPTWTAIITRDGRREHLGYFSTPETAAAAREEALNSGPLLPRGTHRNNTSGTTGVSYDKSRQKWQAYVDRNHKRVCLGRFDTQAEAAAVRTAALTKLAENGTI